VQRPVRYIADVYISLAVERKLRDKYNITPAQVKEAVVLCNVQRSAMEDHPERGERLLVTGVTGDNMTLNVVLYPSGPDDDGLWSLGTAMPAK
jgi:hypothetical protein